MLVQSRVITGANSRQTDGWVHFEILTNSKSQPVMSIGDSPGIHVGSLFARGKDLPSGGQGIVVSAKADGPIYHNFAFMVNFIQDGAAANLNEVRPATDETIDEFRRMYILPDFTSVPDIK